MNRYVRQLNRLAQGFRDAEAEIIAAYFSKPRKRLDHLRWLRAQAFKEFSAIKPIVTALTKLYPHVDRDIDRHRFEELTEKLADETKHARLVMDLLEELTGRKVTFADLLWLPADRQLAKVRSRFSRSYATLLHGQGAIKASEIRRKDEELERAAITVTEGGGGALYDVCSGLRQTGIEAKIARVFREILQDELAHKDTGVRALASLLGTERAFKRAARVVGEICSQRLRMRNEQFGFPLSEDQIRILQQRAQRAASPR